MVETSREGVLCRRNVMYESHSNAAYCSGEESANRVGRSVEQDPEQLHLDRLLPQKSHNATVVILAPRRPTGGFKTSHQRRISPCICYG